MARAYLGLKQTDNAAQLFAETEAVFESGKTQLPDWSVAWHMLTTGQLHDLANRRAMARDSYSAVLKFAKESYVSKSIEDAARAGLESPYRL
jgi:hypothetical protein